MWWKVPCTHMMNIMMIMMKGDIIIGTRAPAGRELLARLLLIAVSLKLDIAVIGQERLLKRVEKPRRCQI